jgi:caa(3)-type oxidase subunit IV
LEKEEHVSGEQHHPIRVYLVVWGALFILSALSYFLDYFDIHPLWLQRFLITAFALIKAALIANYFMHLRFERPALVYAIVLPLVLLIVLAIFTMGEGDYVAWVRQLFFGSK